MATITYGAVIVPVLHEFHPDSMKNIILHSDAKIIFIDENTLDKIDTDRFAQPIITIPNWKIVNRESGETDSFKTTLDKKFAKKHPNGF